MINFFNFFKRKDKYLVLDFGQSSIKGLILEKEEKAIVIKKFGAEEIKKFGVFTARDFESDIVKEAAKKTLRDLSSFNKTPDLTSIVGGFPEILKTEVFDLSFQRKKAEKKIGKAEEEEIYQSILNQENNFLEKIQKKHQQTTRVEIIKKKIIEKKISGYPVPSLLGLRGKKLNFKILIVFAFEKDLKFLKSILTSLGLKKPLIFHEVEGLIKLTKKKNIENRIFVDIGGRTTQIFVFKKGLDSINEFPMGGYDFTKAITNNLKTTEAEAENLKQRMTGNQLTGSARKEIEKIISPVIEDWGKTFFKTLRGKNKSFIALPQKVSFFGGGSLLPQLRKIVEKENFEIEGLDSNDIPLRNKTKFVFSAREVPTLLLAFTQNNTFTF